MTLSKQDATLSLQNQLSALIQEYDENLKPKYENAKNILQTMAEALNKSSDMFTYLIGIYNEYIMLQSGVTAKTPEDRQQLLVRINKEILEELPNISIALKDLDKELASANQEINFLVASMLPLINDYNIRLKNISAQRPKGFFKSAEASQLKKDIKTFCDYYSGKKGLVELIAQQSELLEGFNQIKAMCIKIAKRPQNFYESMDKKINPSNYAPESPTLFSPKLARQRGKEPIEVLPTATSSDSKL